MKKIIVLVSILIAIFIHCPFTMICAEVYDDPNVPITVNAGKKFTIALQSNATTGFAWELSRPLDQSVVKFIDSKYKTLPSPALMVGRGGVEYWKFIAVGKGKAKISLHYIRPWEKQKKVSPQSEKVFTVKVI